MLFRSALGPHYFSDVPGKPCWEVRVGPAEAGCDDAEWGRGADGGQPWAAASSPTCRWTRPSGSGGAAPAVGIWASLRLFGAEAQAGQVWAPDPWPFLLAGPRASWLVSWASPPPCRVRGAYCDAGGPKRCAHPEAVTGPAGPARWWRAGVAVPSRILGGTGRGQAGAPEAASHQPPEPAKAACPAGWSLGLV